MWVQATKDLESQAEEFEVSVIGHPIHLDPPDRLEGSQEYGPVC